MLKYLPVLLGVLMVVSIMPNVQALEYYNFSVEADAIVDPNTPNTNYGTQNASVIDEYNWRTYVTVNTTGLNSTMLDRVYKVVFWNYNYEMPSGEGSCYEKLYYVYDPINETNITWNNQPCGKDEYSNLTIETTPYCDNTSYSVVMIASSTPAWKDADIKTFFDSYFVVGNQTFTFMWDVLDFGNYCDTQGTYRGYDYAGSLQAFDSKDLGGTEPYLQIQRDIQAPNIEIEDPNNATYTTTTIDLNVMVTDDGTIDSRWYSLNSGANTSFSSNTTITGQQGQNHLLFCANDTLANEDCEEVYFFVDSIAPTIQMDSPVHLTVYNITSIPLNVDADEVIDTWLYDIGAGNQTFTPNATIVIPVSPVIYNITVWANDTSGNWNYAEAVFGYGEVVIIEQNTGIRDTLTLSGQGLGGFLGGFTDSLINFLIAIGVVAGILALIYGLSKGIGGFFGRIRG